MPFGSTRGRVFALGLLVLASLVAASPSPAQIYESDNTVLLSHRNEFSGYSDIWGFVGNNGREYVILQTTTSSAWYDVQDPVHPVLIKDIPGAASSWRDAFDIDNHVYLGTEGNGGIQIVDISDPTDPTLVGTYTATVGNSHTVFGDRARKLLYVMGGFADNANGGLQIFDCTNPTNLVELGRWTNLYVHDGSASGTVVHANLISDGRMRIINTAVPTNPVGLGSAFFDPTGACHSSWPFDDGVHLMITEETTGGHVKVLNISNPSSITLVDTYNPAPSQSSHNPHIQGNMAAVSWYTRGTRLLDITTPSNVTEIGYFDTFPGSGGTFSGNWGTFPHFPSGLIASSDISNGLFLFKYEPNAGTLDGTVSSSEGGFVEDATVEYVNLDLTLTTSANGQYRFACFPGPSNQIDFSAFGFQPTSINVAVAPNGTTTTPVVLQKLPSGGLAGTVTDDVSSLPIEAVELEIVGTPLTAVTNAAGQYSFAGIPVGSYQLRALRYGYFVPPDQPITIQVGVIGTKDFSLQPAPVYEDFASVPDWSVTSDPTTTSGFWVFAEPFGTYTGGEPFQTEFDHTLNPETQCAVTGNAASGGIGDDDVDGGATRLLSPVYNLASMAQPHVFYYRWYAQTVEEDEFVVEVTGNGGANWVELEGTIVSDPAWVGRDFDLTGLLGSYTAVQFRFTAADFNSGQVVEAAVDDFTIYDAAAGSTGSPHVDAPGFTLELSQNWPNPFATVTGIRFSIPAKTHVELSVFDVRGRRIAVLEDRELQAGPHEVVWNGTDFTGRRVASGVYFSQLVTSDQIRTRKMIRLD